MSEQISHLETQLGQWKEKFAKFDTKNKRAADQIDSETAALKKELHEAQSARDIQQKEREKSAALLQKRDAEISGMKEELAKAKEEAKKLKDDLLNAPKQEDAGTIAALKKEITSLRDQMGKLLSGKWRNDRDAADVGSPGGMRSYDDASPGLTRGGPRRASTLNSRDGETRVSRLGRSSIVEENSPTLNNRYSITRTTDESRRRANARASVLADTPLDNNGGTMIEAQVCCAI